MNPDTALQLALYAGLAGAVIGLYVLRLYSGKRRSDRRGGLVLFMVAVLTLWANVATAANSNYQHVAIGEGISIEIPKHWVVHSIVEKKNFAAAGEASMRSAGIDNESAGDKNTLLAVSALPTPSGAKIRVSTISPPEFTSAELAATTAKELKESRADWLSAMSKSVSAIGEKLLALDTPRIDKINGRSALLIEYRRTDPRSPSPWTVRMYQIPVADKMILFTISHRESDAAIFKPVIDHVKQSIRF